MKIFQKLNTGARIISSLGLGFLFSLSFANIFDFIKESDSKIISILIAFFVILISILIGIILAKHLSTCNHEHKHINTSDNLFLVFIIIGGLIHTVFDGLVIHEAFTESKIEGFSILGTILIHEIIRNSILFKILRVMSFKKIMSALIIFGSSAIGILAGFVGHNIIEVFHEYESTIHLISGAIFIIITVDLWFFKKHHHKETNILWVIIGVILSILISSIGGHSH